MWRRKAGYHPLHEKTSEVSASDVFICLEGSMLELRFFCGAFHRARGNFAACDGGLHGIEVPRAYEGLMLDSAEAHCFLHFEFAFLHVDEGGHPFAGITVRQFEHAGIERVKARQCDELKFVAHLA